MRRLLPLFFVVVLLLKVSIMLPMLALGAVNTFIIYPRFRRELEREEAQTDDGASKLDRSFYRSVALEATLGALALLVAAFLVFLQPARSHPMNMNGGKAAARSFDRRSSGV
jgi:putative copper export protein